MSIKNDAWIKQQSIKHQMIDPFIHTKTSSGKISYGVSSYGYDARIANEFKIFNCSPSLVIDPKSFSRDNYEEVIVDDFIMVPPNGFVLARTIEYFKIPRDVLVVCLGKSTYARCGIIINVTPLEPEWEGFVTLELSNTSSIPVKVYVNEGICQFIFLSADEICDVSYSDAQGKYMNQFGVVLPRIKS